MNVKKFLAASSREAYRLVREVLGADAVILSNRNVDGSVEILALASEDVSSLAHTEPARKTDSKTELRSKSGERSERMERPEQPYRPATFYRNQNDEDAQDEAESQRHASTYDADPRFERKVWPKYTPQPSAEEETTQEILARSPLDAPPRSTPFAARFAVEPASPGETAHDANESAAAMRAGLGQSDEAPAQQRDAAMQPPLVSQALAQPLMQPPVQPMMQQLVQPSAQQAPFEAPVHDGGADIQPIELGQWNENPAPAAARHDASRDLAIEHDGAMSASFAALAARASNLAAAAGHVSPVPMAPVARAASAASMAQYPAGGAARPLSATAPGHMTTPAIVTPAAAAVRNAAETAQENAHNAQASRLHRESDNADSLSDALHAARQAMAAREAEAAQMTQVVSEIRSMRGMLESQLAEISWSGHQQREPVRAEVMRELLATGFSASLSRYLAEKMPAGLSQERAMVWVKTILARNLTIADDETEIFDKGGVFALVGPTGVGKTTTTAKLAARCVMKHGTSKLALITTDGYRIGGYEQLRIYGKILGVMVHSVKDDADLRIALEELKHKHTVLIDTVGVSQRDNMVAEQVAMLAGAGTPVKRMLCMSATSTGETLSEVVRAYEGSGLDGCILTKLDEAATTGSVLDVAIRQKLKLYFVANGQRVPEDLYVANAQYLVDRAFRLKRQNANYTLRDDELSLAVGNAVRTTTGSETDGSAAAASASVSAAALTDDISHHEVSLG